MASLRPPSTIGILGGGQLGRMMAMKANEMGYKTHIYCPDKDSPAFEKSTIHTIAAYDDEAALKKFAASVDIITYEFENIPTAPLQVIAHKLYPSIGVLEICQHRIKEKETLNRLGIKTAPFRAVRTQQELLKAFADLGATPKNPLIVKTVTMGYDGKGQGKMEHAEVFHLNEITNSTPEGTFRNEVIAEGFVNFSMEISVIVARNESGEIQCYPPVHNTHKNHILHETIAPAPISDALAQKAESMARTIAEGLKLVGILAVEMFVCGDELLVNELAPRPHNSGHWTMDACKTSQFEQVIRAICGLPLGSTEIICPAKMLNLIGDDINDIEKYRAMKNARLHLYGKKESRPGRKMGHVNFLGN
ncbi:MAG: 5-(carboxyamino)imidazole ribonucleotide synthase [Alphaproteobacteria bacterium]